MSTVTIKGEREGLVLALADGEAIEELEALYSEVQSYLESNAAFFQGADVTLDVGERRLDEGELAALLEIADAFDVRVVALRGHDATTRAAARALGLELPLGATTPMATTTESLPEEGRPAFITRRTLRGGQSIRHTDSVVIYGDVNPGAEVVAGGDVIVWGALRGVVHAGASGDDGAIVCALDLSPTQLRIGQYIARPPDENSTGSVLRRLVARLAPRRTLLPEVARVQDGGIVVQAAREFERRPDT